MAHEERANHVERALGACRVIVGDAHNSYEEDAIDLQTDLRQFCDRHSSTGLAIRFHYGGSLMTFSPAVFQICE